MTRAYTRLIVNLILIVAIIILSHKDHSYIIAFIAITFIILTVHDFMISKELFELEKRIVRLEEIDAGVQVECEHCGEVSLCEGVAR